MKLEEPNEHGSEQYKLSFGSNRFHQYNFELSPK